MLNTKTLLDSSISTASFRLLARIESSRQPLDWSLRGLFGLALKRTAVYGLGAASHVNACQSGQSQARIHTFITRSRLKSSRGGRSLYSQRVSRSFPGLFSTVTVSGGAVVATK
ncbi:unnamed protein product [Pieris brassicae]|uniref:Uncharacterized protein n=1 Tax=Pieris brassicae TaxID=7116 RepID=A0A9P0XEK5_PIEBR|nr:unnamed protein product [Pieris brassicae]